MTLNLGMHRRVFEYYQLCSNDDPGLTMTYFMAMSNLVPYAFGERGGSVVECRTSEREVGGSKPTAALYCVLEQDTLLPESTG